MGQSQYKQVFIHVFVQYPTYDSRYDPATESFYVKYGWSGDRVATDTFTYCGPR
ncbi:hypothetical protein [Segetibacter sp. 3557_3]|uniref:hypothetical protein n=1 Tax=Segetibacter sp. 3557_3 TaxID=2547429 RepID=UPI0014045A11|nr:hypothetical protein [Segetibacter sp. 3557_3]